MNLGITYFVIVALLLVCFLIFTLWRNSRNLKSEIQHLAQQDHLIRHDYSARQLCRAIHMINPHVSAGVDYILSHDNPGKDPEIAVWMSDTPRPTKEQLQAALIEVSREKHEEEYAAMRRAEYPSIGEQLEAAYEARQGNPGPQQDVDEKIRRVREKYPKTENCF